MRRRRMVIGMPASTGARRGLARLSTVIGTVVGVAAGAFVVRELASEWSRVSEAIGDASPAWLVGSLVAAGLGMTSIALCWTDALALLGSRRSRGRVTAWYFVGELGKYLPGGVWPVVGRGELARRGGVPRSRAYASVALSLGALYLAAMFVAAVLVPVVAAGGGGVEGPLLVLLLLPVGLALLHPRVLAVMERLARRVLRREVQIIVPSWRASVGLVLRYVPAWLFIGTATWAAARALTPDAGLARVGFAAVLSWIAGFLAVPVPAGAGVREAVFIAACGLPDGIDATVAIAARVAFILVDGVGGLVALPWIRERVVG